MAGMKHFYCTAVFLFSMAGAAFGQGTATSESEAKERFYKGKEFVEDGEFTMAIEEFKESYKLKSIPMVLYNISMCYDELHQYKESLKYLRMYLEKKGDKIDADDKSKVEKRIKELENLLGKISIIVNEPGATLWIDETIAGYSAKLKVGGQEVGHDKKIKNLESTAEGEAGKIQIFLNGKYVDYNPDVHSYDADVGTHEILVAKKGFKDWHKEVGVLSGKVIVVKVDLESEKEASTKTTAGKKEVETKKIAEETVKGVMKDIMQTKLKISCGNKDAIVVVNDSSWGKTPQEKLVDPGKYTILLVAEGYRDWAKVVDIGPGEKVTVYADMKKIDEMPGPEGKGKEKEKEKPAGKKTAAQKIKSQWWLWTIVGVLIGGGVAGAIAGGVYQKGGDEHGTLDTRYPE
jgi:hypothetical protein